MNLYLNYVNKIVDYIIINVCLIEFYRNDFNIDLYNFIFISIENNVYSYSLILKLILKEFF